MNKTKRNKILLIMSIVLLLLVGSLGVLIVKGSANVTSCIAWQGSPKAYFPDANSGKNGEDLSTTQFNATDLGITDGLQILQKITWMDHKETFRVSAHRGAMVAAPEDTLEAFEKAIELGYGAVEMDPQASADGTIYIMHDSTVNRTTDGSGTLSYMTDSQIDELKINTSNYPEYQDQEVKVPTFESVIAALSESDLVVNLDFSKLDWTKTDSLDTMMEILDKYNMSACAFAVITDDSQRNTVSERYPGLCLSWLYDPSTGIDNAIEEVKSYPRAMLSIKDGYLSDSVLEKLISSDIYFQVYDVQSESRMNELKEAGVPMIETNQLKPEEDSDEK